MNFDKLMNSKINAFADWVIRLVLINILIVVTALPVITLLPALCAGYAVLSDYVQKKDVKLVRTYFEYFRQNIGKKLVLGVIIALIFYLSFANSTFYSNVLEQESSTLVLVGYYVTLALLAIAYAVSLYTFVVFKVHPGIRLFEIIKLSFYLAGKFYFITLFLVMVNTIPFLMLLLPLTSVLFVFFGVSLPLLIHALLTRQAVHYLERLGESS